MLPEALDSWAAKKEVKPKGIIPFLLYVCSYVCWIHRYFVACCPHMFVEEKKTKHIIKAK